MTIIKIIASLYVLFTLFLWLIGAALFDRSGAADRSWTALWIGSGLVGSLITLAAIWMEVLGIGVGLIGSLIVVAATWMENAK